MSFTATTTEWAATKAKIAKLNKRAAKAGIPATVQLVKLGERQVSETTEPFGFKRTYTVIDGEVVGAEAVKLGQYRLAAVIDHDPAGNVVREVPGFPYEIPAEFRSTAAARCDHCGLVRNRAETVVVYDEAEGFKQVGKQCVQLFLGVAPHALIAWTVEVGGIGDDMLGGWSSSDPNVTEFVAAAALVTTLVGFTPSSGEGDTTRSLVGELLSVNRSRAFVQSYPELVRPSEEAVAKANELATAAIEWIGNVESDGSSYILNLKTAAARSEVGKNGGLLASLPNAFKRAMQTEAERAAKAAAKAERDAQQAAADWIGTVGAKVTVTAKVVYTNRSAGYAYHSPDALFVILVTDEGQSVWVKTTVETAVGIALEDADRDVPVLLTGTVKEHRVNNKGQKVTVLTRCKAV